MPKRQITWIAVETTKDDQDERGKNLDLVREVLEDDVANLVLDVDGVLYNVEVLGVGGTTAEALVSVDARANAKKQAIL